VLFRETRFEVGAARVRALTNFVEGMLWCFGLIIVVLFTAHLGLQELQRMNAVAAFRSAEAIGAPVDAIQPGSDTKSVQLPGDNVTVHVAKAGSAGQVGMIDYEPPAPNQSLWSTGRIASFAASLAENTSPVLGIFEIPRFELELPIYDGATELHMDRGIAQINGTAMPGHDEGNLGIAGHRDGYFRVLKDIRFGDEISVTTSAGKQIYVVEQLMIVDPGYVEVLHSTPTPTITLVTCYPFYFVGHAPQRFIVQATLQES
jgi:sortase A